MRLPLILIFGAFLCVSCASGNYRGEQEEEHQGPNLGDFFGVISRGFSEGTSGQRTMPQRENCVYYRVGNQLNRDCTEY